MKKLIITAITAMMIFMGCSTFSGNGTNDFCWDECNNRWTSDCPIEGLSDITCAYESAGGDGGAGGSGGSGGSGE